MFIVSPIPAPDLSLVVFKLRGYQNHPEACENPGLWAPLQRFPFSECGVQPMNTHS